MGCSFFLFSFTLFSLLFIAPTQRRARFLGEERHDKTLHQPLAFNDVTILRPKEMNTRTFEPNHRGISDFTNGTAT